MTPEAALTKLSYVLGKNITLQEKCKVCYLGSFRPDAGLVFLKLKSTGPFTCAEPEWMVPLILVYLFTKCMRRTQHMRPLRVVIQIIWAQGNLFVCLFINLFLYSFIHCFVHLSIHPPIHPFPYFIFYCHRTFYQIRSVLDWKFKL